MALLDAAEAHITETYLHQWVKTIGAHLSIDFAWGTGFDPRGGTMFIEGSISVKTVCVIGSILYALIVAFAGKFCKQSSMPSINTSESLARLAVEDGGGQWVGIQEAEGMPYDFVLFNASTGSTLSLKTTEITAERVREKLVVHEEFRRANFCFVVRAAINRQQRRVQRDKHLGKGAVEHFANETSRQNNLCAVCDEPLIKSPRADHNHKIRG